MLLVAAVMMVAAAAAQASSVAFLRDGNIWLAAPDGSGAHPLTSDGTSADPYTSVSASKAPGTTLLAFRHGDAMGVIGADGSGQRTVPSPRGLQPGTGVDIDPSGTRLAYVAPTGYGTYGATIAADGSSGGFFSNYQARVLDVAFASPIGGTVLWAGYLSGAPGEVHHPNCTPAGGVESFGIAFQAWNADGAAQANPTSGFFCIPGDDVLAPEGSPDGSQILAAAGPRDGATRIIEIASSTMMGFSEPPGQFVYETPAGIDATDPDWSPDLARIAFTGQASSVWVTAAGGSGAPLKILDNARNPAWSPYTPPGAGSGAPGGGSGGQKAARPNTKLTSRRLNRRKHTARFKFKAVGPASRFQCALVKRKAAKKGHKPRRRKPRYSRCRSPKTYKHLRGSYTFYVRAIGKRGADRTPATATFRMRA